MIRPPIIGAETWRLVMSAADYRCQCEGACGSRHTPTGQRTPGVQHRCPRLRGEQVPGQGVPIFVVAPARPAVSAMVAARLPVAELRAWCPSCYSAALAVARRQAKTAPAQAETLFDAGQDTHICTDVRRVSASELCPRDCVCAVDLPDGTHLDLPERPEVLAARTLPERHVTVVAFLDRDAEALPETARVTVVRRGAA